MTDVLEIRSRPVGLSIFRDRHAILNAHRAQIGNAIDAVGQSKNIGARCALRDLIRQPVRLIQRLVNQVVMKFRVDVDQGLIAHAKRAERQGDSAVPPAPNSRERASATGLSVYSRSAAT